MTRLVGWGILVLLLCPPVAATAIVTGDVVVQGPLDLRSGARIEGPPQAVYLGDSANVTYFHAEFPVVTVWERHKATSAVLWLSEVPTALDESARDEYTSYVLHDVRMDLDVGNSSGYLGIFPNRSSSLTVDLPINSQVNPSEGRSYGETQSPTTLHSPGARGYRVDVARPHVQVQGAAAIEYAGPGALKVYGLDLVLNATENTTRFETGELTRAEGVYSRQVQRWLYLDFTEATIWIDSPNGFELALSSADVTWSGSARMQPVGGDLTVDRKDVVINGSPLEVEGSILARAKALRGERLQLVIVSQENGGVLGSARAMAPQTPWALPGIGLLLALAIGAGGAATLLIHRRSQSRLDPDEMLTLAHLAGEGGRHDEALGWIRRARSAAPESGALALEEAFHLGELGLVDEALATYREAARLLGDGQAEMDAALLGLGSGALSPAEAESLLVTALARSPALLLELEDHPALRGLVVGPALSSAMRAARRRLGEP